jgi:hypothetical protein
VTTGGPGPDPREVTPEATEPVCDRMLPGFGEMMRSVLLQSVPTAILSRQTAGAGGSCLIVNLLTIFGEVGIGKSTSVRWALSPRDPLTIAWRCEKR